MPVPGLVKQRLLWALGVAEKDQGEVPAGARKGTQAQDGKS